MFENEIFLHWRTLHLDVLGIRTQLYYIDS